MRLIRVHTPGALSGPGHAVLAAGPAAHVTRVLRLRSGDPVTLFNGDGWDYRGHVRAMRSGSVEVEIDERVAARPESALALTLVQGVARADRMDAVVQKATELGVRRLVPVLAQRSVVRLDPDQAARRLAHWRAGAVAAGEQCGRAVRPEIEPPLPLPAWLDRPAGRAARVLLAPGAAAPLAAVTAPAVEVLVGPEGGLTDAEERLALGAGFEPRPLGPRILRTETAALAALVVLQATCGDFAPHERPT